MNAFDCTSELDVDVSSTWRDWLDMKGYKPFDSATVCIFKENLSLFSLKFEVFSNERRKKWAVFYPPIVENGEPMLFVEIVNFSYATFLLELGLAKTKESIYRTMVEAGLNEGKKQ